MSQLLGRFNSTLRNAPIAQDAEIYVKTDKNLLMLPINGNQIPGQIDQRKNDYNPHISSIATDRLNNVNNVNKRPTLLGAIDLEAPTNFESQAPNGMHREQIRPGVSPLADAVQLLPKHGDGFAAPIRPQDVACDPAKPSTNLQVDITHQSVSQLRKENLDDQALGKYYPDWFMSAPTALNLDSEKRIIPGTDLREMQIPYVNYRAPSQIRFNELNGTVQARGQPLQSRVPEARSLAYLDYQALLMVVEQQNKKRLQHQREQRKREMGLGAFSEKPGTPDIGIPERHVESVMDK